jgi:hypothetical protein
MRILVVLALAGCFQSFAPRPRRTSSPLPSRNDDYTQARKRSAVADDRGFDLEFRANIRNYGDLEGVNGVDQLRYPESNHADAAQAYVQLGDRAASVKRWGEAGQAYWAALGLTSRTVASRRQREQIRRAAYTGLAKVAVANQKPEWASLLGLCAGLADTYLGSPIAETHHDEFYTTLEGQTRAQRRAEEAEARARRGLLLQQIAAGVSVAATVTAGATGSISQAEVNARAAQIGQQVAATNEQAREVEQAMNEAMGAISASVGQLREVSARDVPDIQAGRSFVARQVGWYLLAAADPLPYLDGPLATYVRGRPPLRRALETARAAFASKTPAAAATGLKVNMHVQAQWTDGSWYPGTIVRAHNGLYDIDYDDGDHSDDLPAAKVRAEGNATASGLDEGRKQAIADLALAFVAVERHVAMYERNRAIPPPEYVTSVCGPKGGAIECYLAAMDLCRAAIDEGCGLLVTISGGAP